jgi:tRNA pseudouridine38-40 synthase
VQGVLHIALARVVRERVRTVGSSRTDAGVHAEGQVVSVRLETALDPPRLCSALNAALPDDVAVREVAMARDDFDARRHATGKLYRYSIWNGPIRAPLRRRRALCLQRPLDLAALRTAAARLVGTHDFASFQAAGSPVKTTVRTLRRLDATGEPGAAIDLWFEGDGFLRHMVRNLTGTLIEVGSGRRAPDGMVSLLAARDRSRAGPTAPPQGLTLVRVTYPQDGPPVERDSDGKSRSSG